MSEQEQDAVILRVVKRRAEAKRQRGLLESELRAAGKAIYEAGGRLQHLSANNQDAAGTLELVEKHAGALPERVVRMMREYAELERTIGDLDAQAKQIGIE